VKRPAANADGGDANVAGGEGGGSGGVIGAMPEGIDKVFVLAFRQQATPATRTAWYSQNPAVGLRFVQHLMEELATREQGGSARIALKKT
jgi:hypothetical protein